MNESHQSPMNSSVPPAGQPMPPSSPFMAPPPAKKNAWLVIVLVVVIVLAAGYYVYSDYFNMWLYPVPEVENMGMMKPKPVLPEDTAAIETDLQTVPLEDLDSELGDIDAELAR